MSDFSWQAELATRLTDHPVLLDKGRNWSAGAVLTELKTVGEYLASSRVVGVLADNSPAWVIADLACQDNGLVHLPLPGFFHPDQLSHALEQAGADTILTDQPERVGALDLGFSITGSWQGLTWMRRIIKPVPLPAGTSKISFTSGSTGSPKGVCLSTIGLLDTARAVQERLADLPLSSHLAVLPLSLLLENVAGVYTPLLRGMPVHLPKLGEIGWQGMQGFDPGTLNQQVHATNAGSVILVPELLKAWSTFLTVTGASPPPSLQFAAVGGALVAPELLISARRVGIPVYQGYGLTEGGSVLAINRPGDDHEGVGRPLAHAHFRVDDGELIISTRAFLGYVGQPEPGLKAFGTGDLASFDNRGHLHLEGRRKNLLITSFGRNISPEWVEATLLAQPKILQTIVIGEGQPALTAIIVPLPGTPETAILAAINQANARLPDYARIAKFLISPPFTVTNDLATGNGRPRRAAIIHHHSAALAALNFTEES